MSSSFIYVGTDERYGGERYHAFYSPTYQKMWCFRYLEWNGILDVGMSYNLDIPFGVGYVEELCEMVEDDFIGNKEHWACKNIEQYKVLYPAKTIFSDFDKEKHLEKVWIF